MRAFLVFALAASATAQLKFGSDPTEAPKKDVNTRLGLLGTSLGLSPTAEQTSGSSSSGGQSSAFTQGSGQTPTGRVPSGGEFTGSFSSCCCVPLSEQCGDPLGRDIDYDFIGSCAVIPNDSSNKLKNALNAQRAGSGNRFSLSTSEICAGGQVGKDACTGDGGSPLVCQGLSGRWTVVGLVTWGVGCASDVPGVYARMSHFTQWINEN